MLLVTLLSIGIIAIVVGYSIDLHKDSFESASSATFNFSYEIIGWAIFTLTGIIVGVISISVFVRTIRKGNNK